MTDRRQSDATSGNWALQDGRAVHPDAPAGGGGQGFFNTTGPVGLNDEPRMCYPHPQSPIGRNLNSTELDAFLQAVSNTPNASPVPPAEMMRQKVAQIAKSYVDSVQWQEFPDGPATCSAFVNDVLKEAGSSPGNIHKTHGYYWDQVTDRLSHLFNSNSPHVISKHQYPALAGDWANPKFAIPHWMVVEGGPKQAQAGDIIAEPIDYNDASGHVGIVVGKNQTASADSTAMPPGMITISNYGFRADDDKKKYGHASKCVVRRYTDDLT